jgi:hypothetical protein
MKEHFGLEIHHKGWKLFLILDQLGPGYFLKIADLAIVLSKIKNLNITHLQNSNKT